MNYSLHLFFSNLPLFFSHFPFPRIARSLRLLIFSDSLFVSSSFLCTILCSCSSSSLSSPLILFGPNIYFVLQLSYQSFWRLPLFICVRLSGHDSLLCLCSSSSLVSSDFLLT